MLSGKCSHVVGAYGVDGTEEVSSKGVHGVDRGDLLFRGVGVGVSVHRWIVT